MHPKWGDVPPILAVEVWSPTDRPSRTNEKIREYLKSGVKIVWHIDYEEQSASPTIPAAIEGRRVLRSSAKLITTMVTATM